MRLIFSRSNKVGSWLIRAATWSKWSHVAVEIDGWVIEASYPRVSKSRLDDYLLARKDHCITHIISMPNEAAAIKYALSQVGVKYDWMALLGMPIQRDWQDNSKWFCSELVAAVIEHGGLKLFRDGSLGRVTPQNLWMLSIL